MTTITELWVTAADLPAAARWDGQHDGAVTLDDTGVVLVAGGADAAGTAVKQSAFYDPADDKWHPAGALGKARRLHTMTRLADGKVLVAGGLGAAGEQLADAEVFDPKTHSWAPASGPMAQVRWGHSATLLPDGTVLVAGGTAIRAGSTVHALRSAERYHPDTGTWTAAADMTDARTGHTSLPLAGGAVLVCGGAAPVGATDDPALAFCELYDPAHDRWAPTGSLTHGRRHHQATRLSDHGVLFTGGAAPGAPGGGPFDPFSQRTAERFDLTTGIWTPVKDMPSGRALHRAVLLGDGTVLVVGGGTGDRDEAGFRSAVLYNATGDTWTPLPGLANGRSSFAATLSAGQVLVAGGVARSGLAAADPATTELTASTEIFTAGSAA
jgi:N-acetylneuraminic acid mutarotase